MQQGIWATQKQNETKLNSALDVPLPPGLPPRARFRRPNLCPGPPATVSCSVPFLFCAVFGVACFVHRITFFFSMVSLFHRATTPWCFSSL